MKKFELFLAERDKGLTYQEIADKYGVSRQRVGQVCGKYQSSRFRFISENGCIYPNLRKWLNDNKMTSAELLRRLGYSVHSTNYDKIQGCMRGSKELKKSLIDKLIAVTGLSYEKLFETDAEAESDDR